MQFGRLIGTSLIILGLILISVQAWSSLYGGRMHAEQIPVHNVQRSDTGHLPGIVGTLLMVAGFVMVVAGRRKDEPDANRAVK